MTTIADMTDSEKHYANMFWSTYIGAGMTPDDARAAALTEVYRERCRSGADKLAIRRARTAQSDAWQNASGISGQRWTRPDEFKAAMISMTPADQDEIEAAIDAIALSGLFGPYGPVAEPDMFD